MEYKNIFENFKNFLTEEENSCEENKNCGCVDSSQSNLSIEEIQSFLKKLYPDDLPISYSGRFGTAGEGSPDGVCGSETRQVIMKFQKEAKISCDACVGEETEAAMRKRLPSFFKNKQTKTTTTKQQTSTTTTEKPKEKPKRVVPDEAIVNAYREWYDKLHAFNDENGRWPTTEERLKEPFKGLREEWVRHLTDSEKIRYNNHLESTPQRYVPSPGEFERLLDSKNKPSTTSKPTKVSQKPEKEIGESDKPYVLPLNFTKNNFFKVIKSDFGSKREGSKHYGTDYFVVRGTKVYALMDGKVEKVINQAAYEKSTDVLVAKLKRPQIPGKNRLNPKSGYEYELKFEGGDKRIIDKKSTAELYKKVRTDELVKKGLARKYSYKDLRKQYSLRTWAAGIYVKLRHDTKKKEKNPAGVTYTRYLHLHEVYVGPGDDVTKGQVIGTVGNTGCFESGPHLHFELYQGGFNSADRRGSQWFRDNDENVGRIGEPPTSAQSYQQVSNPVESEPDTDYESRAKRTDIKDVSEFNFSKQELRKRRYTARYRRNMKLSLSELKRKFGRHFSYTFGVLENDGTIKIEDSFQQNTKRYGASMPKTIAALAHLIEYSPNNPKNKNNKKYNQKSQITDCQIKGLLTYWSRAKSHGKSIDSSEGKEKFFGLNKPPENDPCVKRTRNGKKREPYQSFVDSNYMMQALSRKYDSRSKVVRDKNGNVTAIKVLNKKRKVVHVIRQPLGILTEKMIDSVTKNLGVNISGKNKSTFTFGSGTNRQTTKDMFYFFANLAKIDEQKFSNNDPLQKYYQAYKDEFDRLIKIQKMRYYSDTMHPSGVKSIPGFSWGKGGLYAGAVDFVWVVKGRNNKTYILSVYTKHNPKYPKRKEGQSQKQYKAARQNAQWAANYQGYDLINAVLYKLLEKT